MYSIIQWFTGQNMFRAADNFGHWTKSKWENCEHQKYFWDVIVLQEKSQLGMRNKTSSKDIN